MPNNNESATVQFLKKFRQINRAYVEMEFVSPRMVTAAAPGAVKPDTYPEWLRLQRTSKLVPGNWKADPSDYMGGLAP